MVKVMIVDDDPMVVKFNGHYLNMVEGFELAATAHSAAESLRLLEEYEIDLVLLDIFMPGMGGLDLLTQLRRIGKGVDVMIVSAACDSQSIKTALRFGAVDYIIKPFEFERLNAALSAYRELTAVMEEQAQLNQNELDSFLLSTKNRPVREPLPKGIDPHTLTTVWETIQSLDGNAFSTEELAQLVGISRISMRKYLDFLKQRDLLILRLIYGTVGRPVYKYRCLQSSPALKRFLF
ncbi:Transcriptional regulatory protein MalR [Propionispora sp. 2/2-37]|uniref:response regulator n=1 Tax=Propionispora sp. 2/2-37 TaxID=1677858 RepID=UPI0006BB91DD|nr:response regulator [Propionispora sp. 2/2-37]CUH97305.1 Transcriptional regulatory protein MalR [Propionispora sp. 2/2-37]